MQKRKMNEKGGNNREHMFWASSAPVELKIGIRTLAQGLHLKGHTWLSVLYGTLLVQDKAFWEQYYHLKNENWISIVTCVESDWKLLFFFFFFKILGCFTVCRCKALMEAEPCRYLTPYKLFNMIRLPILAVYIITFTHKKKTTSV